MNRFRKTAIATFAATAIIAAGSVTTPTQAHAGGKIAAALIGGAIVGGLIAASAKPAYAAPVYTTHCFWQQQHIGHNAYGHPVYQKVQVCH